MAKIRQHTDLSIKVLETVTIRLGGLLRDFRDVTCKAFDTKELSREVAARMRRTSKKASSASIQADLSPTTTLGKQKKPLNLNTYKDHSLGDYVETIKRYGTVDSYSTEAVSYTSFRVFLTLKRN